MGSHGWQGRPTDEEKTGFLICGAHWGASHLCRPCGGYIGDQHRASGGALQSADPSRGTRGPAVWGPAPYLSFQDSLLAPEGVAQPGLVEPLQGSERYRFVDPGWPSPPSPEATARSVSLGYVVRPRWGQELGQRARQQPRSSTTSEPINGSPIAPCSRGLRTWLAARCSSPERCGPCRPGPDSAQLPLESPPRQS